MKAVHLGLVLSVIVLSFSGHVNAATRIKPIHPERETMRPADKRKLVLADLNAILTGPASPTSVVTAPYLSSRDGLCQRDVIVLSYEAVEDGKRDGPLVPKGIRENYTEYHRLGYANRASHHDWRKLCKRLAGESLNWVRSDSDATAEFALGSLEAAVANVQKTSDFTINCEKLKKVEHENKCASKFLAAVSQIHSAYRCLDQSGECYVFGTSNYEITIVRNYPQYSIIIDYMPIIVT